MRRNGSSRQAWTLPIWCSSLLVIGCSGGGAKTPAKEAPEAALPARIELLGKASAVSLWIGDFARKGTPDIALSADMTAQPADGGALRQPQTLVGPSLSSVVIARDAGGNLVVLQSNAGLDFSGARFAGSLVASQLREEIGRLLEALKKGIDAADAVNCGIVTGLVELVAEGVKRNVLEAFRFHLVMEAIIQRPFLRTEGGEDFVLCLRSPHQSIQGCIGIQISRLCNGATGWACSRIGNKNHCYQVIDDKPIKDCWNDVALSKLCDKATDRTGCCNRDFIYDKVFMSDLRNMAPMAVVPATGRIVDNATVILGGYQVSAYIKEAIPDSPDAALIGCFLEGLISTRNPVTVSLPQPYCGRNAAQKYHVLQGDVDQCLSEDGGGVYSQIKGTGTDTRYAGLNESQGPMILGVVRDHFRANVRQTLAEMDRLGLCCSGREIRGGTVTIREKGGLEIESAGMLPQCPPAPPAGGPDAGADGPPLADAPAPVDAGATVEVIVSRTGGDPHMLTWDGVRYSFQTVGEFLLAAEGPDMVVQARQMPFRNSRNVSMNRAVAARVGPDRVAVYTGDELTLRVNGTVTPVTTPLDLAGGGRVARGQGGITVTWPSGDRMVIVDQREFVSVVLQLVRRPGRQVRGLLGDANGKRDDDFRMRDGTVLPPPLSLADLHQKFGESWRVTQADSLFDYAAGETTETFTDRAFPYAPASTSQLTEAAYRAAENICLAAGVAPGPALEECVLDVGLTGSPAFADAQARAESHEAGASAGSAASACGTALACGPGLTCCAGGCVDARRDAVNCGSCGRGCGSAGRCVDGACQACGSVGCAANVGGSPESPGLDCADLLTRGIKSSGPYWIKPGNAPVRVMCEMTADGGGWTRLTDVIAPTLKPGARKQYLYLYMGRWYRSPTTTLSWSWNTSQELRGEYTYSDGVTVSTYTCQGSSEKPGFGIGCSDGGGALQKTLPIYQKDSSNGTCTVCQDKPFAFGAFPCANMVAIYVREVTP